MQPNDRRAADPTGEPSTRPSRIIPRGQRQSADIIPLAAHRGRRTLAQEMRQAALAETVAHLALEELEGLLEAEGLPRGPALRALLDLVAVRLLPRAGQPARLPGWRRAPRGVGPTANAAPSRARRSITGTRHRQPS